MENKKTLADIADFIAGKYGLSKADSSRFAKTFFDVIEEKIGADKYVKVKGLGTFKLVSVDSRSSVNVNTGERFEIQSHFKITFTPDGQLKDSVNRPFADFETVVLGDDVDVQSLEDVADDVDGEATGVAELREGTVADSVVMEQSEEVSASAKEISTTVEMGSGVLGNAIQEKVSEERLENVDGAKVDSDESNAAGPVEQMAVFPDVPEPPPGAVGDSERRIERGGEDDCHSFFSGRFVKRFFVLFVPVFALMVLSYFAGYYNVMSPDKQNGTETVSKLNVVKKSSKGDGLKPPGSVSKVDTLLNAKTEKPKDSVRVDEKVLAAVKEVKKVEGQKKENDEVVAVHRIKDGESLVGISRKYYGTKKHYLTIAKYNGIKDPDHVEPGVTLRIPRIN